MIRLLQWKMSFITDVNKQVEEVHSKEQNKKTMLAPTEERL